MGLDRIADEVLVILREAELLVKVGPASRVWRIEMVYENLVPALPLQRVPEEAWWEHHVLVIFEWRTMAGPGGPLSVPAIAIYIFVVDPAVATSAFRETTTVGLLVA